MGRMRYNEVICLDCKKPDCSRIKAEFTKFMLGDSQLHALELIGDNPGIIRADLGALIWPRKNARYATPKAIVLADSLERRGLIEYDEAREGSRSGTVGCYLVGFLRLIKPGYLGVSGRVYPKTQCQHCGLNPPHQSAYCLQCIKSLVAKGLGGSVFKTLAST